jgi:hypothetical protein
MTNYQITIGYKAVICIDVKANSEEEAKEKATELFNNTVRTKPYQNPKVTMQDDTFKVDGICDMDRTWNML